MKAYIITTGTLFGLIVVAHVLRVVEEPPSLRTPGTFSLPLRLPE